MHHLETKPSSVRCLLEPVALELNLHLQKGLWIPWLWVYHRTARHGMRLNGCNAVWQFFKMRVRKLDRLWRVLQIRDTEQPVLLYYNNQSSCPYHQICNPLIPAFLHTRLLICQKITAIIVLEHHSISIACIHLWSKAQIQLTSHALLLLMWTQAVEASKKAQTAFLQQPNNSNINPVQLVSLTYDPTIVKWPDKISCQSLSAHTRETGERLNNLMGDFLYIMWWTVLNYNTRHCNLVKLWCLHKCASPLRHLPKY